MARPRKKETEEKALAKITQDLVKENPDISDVGAILACLKHDVSSLEKLKKECTDVDEFLAIASKRANVAIVTAAIEAAIGYEYEETEQLIRKTPRYDSNGVLTTVDVPSDLKIRKKHSKRDPSLLKFILLNRLPEYFSDTKKVEINKKIIEIKADTEAEIRSFAGRLMDAFKDEDIIDGEVIERDS